MDGSDFQRILHIASYCEDVARTIQRFGVDYKTFAYDSDYFNSISMSVMQIGELANGLSDEFREETKTEIPWGLVRGMRNMFAHAYSKIDKSVIWDVARNDIPELRRFCDRILEQDREKPMQPQPEDRSSILGRLQEIQSGMTKDSNAKAPEIQKKQDDPIR